MNLADKRAFDEAAKENLDPYCQARIERAHRQNQRDNGLDEHGRRPEHAEGPTPAMRTAADLEEQWGRVAAAITQHKNELAVGVFEQLTGEMQDLLKEAAEALTPSIQKAMARKREQSEEYTKLFDEFFAERAKV